MARAAFLLRVIRQTRQRPPRRGEDALVALNWFGVALVPRLHALVAVGVGKKSSANVAELLNNRKWSGRLTSKALWEGNSHTLCGFNFLSVTNFSVQYQEYLHCLYSLLRLCSSFCTTSSPTCTKLEMTYGRPWL